MLEATFNLSVSLSRNWIGEDMVNVRPHENAKIKKIEGLVEDLGSEFFEIRDAATRELADRVKADPTSGKVFQKILELATMSEAEVKVRVDRLQDVEEEKKNLAAMRDEKKMLHDRINRIQKVMEKWIDKFETGDPDSEEGKWVAENTGSIESYLIKLKERLAQRRNEERELQISINEEEKKLKSK